MSLLSPLLVPVLTVPCLHTFCTILVVGIGLIRSPWKGCWIYQMHQMPHHVHLQTVVQLAHAPRSSCRVFAASRFVCTVCMCLHTHEFIAVSKSYEQKGDIHHVSLISSLLEFNMCSPAGLMTTRFFAFLNESVPGLESMSNIFISCCSVNLGNGDLFG